ncbi:STAS domain-containing protein [Eubacterium sp. 1001713B170207_170306_E7]|uniref:STAS domain-containing protein n=1 Tax=Eubacterium sp. 1001713B170207_170306_E7 TaxID=2787097 RepID=UPI001897BB23|nr:STAS domain-containing protein [Eubacterium sp. 1001713B170207_170306_E7]
MFEISELKNDRDGVCVTGEVDIYTATQFKEPIEKLIQAGTKEIFLDLTNLSYIDSTGIGILIELRKGSMSKGLDMTLINPQKNVVKLLQLTGVDQIFNIIEEK